MVISKVNLLSDLKTNLEGTEINDLVFLYNTEFAKIDNYKLIKIEEDNVTVSKTNAPITKENLVTHMLDTMKILNRNHFVASIYNLITVNEKVKYDYEADNFIVI